MRRFFVLVLIGIIFFSPDIFSCTTFILRDGRNLYFGRNLDWVTGTGLIMTNQRNLEKTSLADSTLKWVSKFGSITFNQVGKELPYGGMNEAGLVVEHMSYQETNYPEKDQRGGLEPCQWIQFQLDNYSTVEEIIKSDKLVRIIDSPSKFHFLVCDRYGRSAVIEFMNGKMVYYTGKDLPYEALANSSYNESTDCFSDQIKSRSNPSLSNFTTAVQMINDNDYNTSPVEYSFDILKSISQGLMTKWSIVYDITNMNLYVKVFETPVIIGENKIFTKQPGVSKIKTINLKEFNFECSQTARVLDLNYDVEGKVEQYFIDYTADTNKEYIAKAFKFFEGWGVGISLKDEEIDSLAKYPESFICKGN